MKHYTYEDERWMCRAPDELAAEFGVDPASPEQMELLHRSLIPHKRAWVVVRRLFGIGPVYILDNAADERVWTRGELLETLRITRKQLEAELETARGFYHSFVVDARPPNHQANLTKPSTGRDESLQQQDMPLPDDLLNYYGFDASMFEVNGRSAEENAREKTWFTEVLNEWSFMFQSPLAGQIARNALLNMLRMRRLEVAEMKLQPTSKDYSKIRRDFSELESAYQEQVKELDLIFPWKREVSGKMSGKATVSALIEAIRAYRADRNHDLVDGIFAAAEIEVEVRTHSLSEDPQYRLGLVTYLLEAKTGLWDPHWQSRFSPATLAKLDKGFKEGVKMARQDIGEALVDIESEGEDGEYPEIPPVLLVESNDSGGGEA